MLRKSVETRDWLNTIEPRTVRAVMKRVVEDITTMDVQVFYVLFPPIVLSLDFGGFRGFSEENISHISQIIYRFLFSKK